jgi:hypothetical protein
VIEERRRKEEGEKMKREGEKKKRVKDETRQGTGQDKTGKKNRGTKRRGRKGSKGGDRSYSNHTSPSTDYNYDCEREAVIALLLIMPPAMHSLQCHAMLPL